MLEDLLKHRTGVMGIGSSAVEEFIFIYIIKIYRCLYASLRSLKACKEREDRLEIQEKHSELGIHLKELEVHLKHGRIRAAPADKNGVAAELSKSRIYILERFSVQARMSGT